MWEEEEKDMDEEEEKVDERNMRVKEYKIKEDEEVKDLKTWER